MIFVDGQIMQWGRLDAKELPGGVDRAGLNHAPNAFFCGGLEDVKRAGAVDVEDILRGPRRRVGDGGQMDDGVAAADHFAQAGVVVDIAGVVFGAFEHQSFLAADDAHSVALGYQAFGHGLSNCPSAAC